MVRDRSLYRRDAYNVTHILRVACKYYPAVIWNGLLQNAKITYVDQAIYVYTRGISRIIHAIARGIGFLWHLDVCVADVIYCDVG